MNFIKVNTTYEISVNDNKYQLIIPANAPLGEAYDVTFKFLAILAEQAKATAEAIKPNAQPEVESEIVKK